MRVNATTHAWLMIKTVGLRKTVEISIKYAQPMIGEKKETRAIGWPFWATVRNIALKENKRLAHG